MAFGKAVGMHAVTSLKKKKSQKWDFFAHKILANGQIPRVLRLLRFEAVFRLVTPVAAAFSNKSMAAAAVFVTLRRLGTAGICPFQFHRNGYFIFYSVPYRRRICNAETGIYINYY